MPSELEVHECCSTMANSLESAIDDVHLSIEHLAPIEESVWETSIPEILDRHLEDATTRNRLRRLGFDNTVGILWMALDHLAAYQRTLERPGVLGSIYASESLSRISIESLARLWWLNENGSCAAELLCRAIMQAKESGDYRTNFLRAARDIESADGKRYREIEAAIEQTKQDRRALSDLSQSINCPSYSKGRKKYLPSASTLCANLLSKAIDDDKRFSSIPYRHGSAYVHGDPGIAHRTLDVRRESPISRGMLSSVTVARILPTVHWTVIAMQESLRAVSQHWHIESPTKHFEDIFQQVTECFDHHRDEPTVS